LVFRFILNPYFIFRVFSFVIGAFLGMDLFNIKNTFTDISDDDSNENKKDQINKDEDKKGKGVSSKTDINKNNSQPTTYTKSRFLDLYKFLGEEQNKLFKANEDNVKDGNITQSEHETMVDQLVEDRIKDAKAVYELTKDLNNMTMNNESTNNLDKRPIGEEDYENNKKSKGEESKNKRSIED
jgi:hypothetical protein